MIRAESFDVFDTCLVRVWPRPVDVLHAAAARTVPGDLSAREELLSEVVRRRQQAELRALERADADAVTLDEIFADPTPFEGVGVDAAALHEAELAVEREGARPVRAAMERVQAARAAGHRVLFISDMYLPAPLIHELLEEHGFIRSEDRLFVSGELGVSKRTGRLFDHVLRSEGLDASELLHHGDDRVTDEAMAVRRGILVRPLRVAELSRFERHVLERTHGPRLQVARVAGLMRVTRLTAAPESGSIADATTIFADVVAPMFVAYVAWVLELARREGLRRLYFVSRDSQVLLRAANALRCDGDPECRYLYGSRQAWFLPGIQSLDREALYWILEPQGSLRTPRALLAKLQLTPAELEVPLGDAGLAADARMTSDDLERFWAVLEGSSALVREHAAAARDLLTRYLRQERLLGDAEPWAIVDIGWRLTAQRALREVLRQSGEQHRILGIYFGMSQKRAPLAETGAFHAFLIEDNDPTRGSLPEDWVFRASSFIEQVFAMADHGSCAGYQDTPEGVRPVLRDPVHDPVREHHVRCLHAIVVSFARELGPQSSLLRDDLGLLREAALVSGRLAVEHPARAEAEALGWIRVGDDQNETRVRSLAAPLSARNIVLNSATKLGIDVHRDFDTEPVWREGSLRLTPLATRWLYVQMRAAERRGRDVHAAARIRPLAVRLRRVGRRISKSHLA